MIASVACFFLNFATVSFLGFSGGASGFEFATTISLHEGLEFDEEDNPNPCLIVSILCAFFSFATIWEVQEKDKKALVSGGFAAAGALALFLFRTTFSELNKMAGYELLLSLKFGPGWTLSLLTFVGAAGAAFATYNVGSRNKGMPIKTYSSTPAEDTSRENTTIGDETQRQSAIDDSTGTPGPTPSDISVLIPKITIHSRSKTGMVQEWQPTEFPCLIGRDADTAQIIIPDAHMSKIHAKLYIDMGALMIADENSSNGTFFNGEKIGYPVEILSGDIVTIGETRLFFEVSG